MPQSTGRTASSGCRSGEVSLPVVDGSGPRGGRVQRNPRMGRRRAAMLVLVQLAIIAHVVIWWLSGKYGWFGGETITPIEPSESMEFSKYGIVNAGLIFFVIALLSTLILGRWFCGWGCHVVMLQDFCLWIMRRFKIHPKPFRSRLLLWAPLILAIYMFIWPLFYRFVIAPFTRPELEWPGISLHLTTTDFWATFPGVFVAIIFLGVCGFATVYVLGAKGFCTYGCPYGGFFAPFDKVAPMRIRVTDACQGCAHCTAVCTSNVRVHEEVRTWGMVTDPGCMKTMDCVTNCPTKALYVGFGKTALRRNTVKRMEPRPRKWDLSITEEIILAIVCLLLFWAWRGLYNAIPMLMAIGIASVLTWVFWRGWRLIRDQNASLHRWRLKYHGRLRLPGVVFGIVVLVLLALSLQALVIRSATWNGNRLLHRVDMPVHMALDPSRPPMDQAATKDAKSALESFRLASSFDSGGIGFVDNPNILLDAARLHLILGDPDRAIELHQKVRRSQRSNQSVDQVFLLVKASVDTPENVQRFEDETLQSHPEWIAFRSDAINRALSQGDRERAHRLLDDGLEAYPNALELLKVKSVLLVQDGQTADGIELMQRFLEAAPGDALAWATLARTYALEQRVTEGDEAMAKALSLAPSSRAVVVEAIGYYLETGRPSQARMLESRLNK
ncbi:MAG: 4Fe-4S binding protein [Planctomycetota bacterium]|nr:4Fe-4S binding protein [Planctomycetota bacterium]